MLEELSSVRHRSQISRDRSRLSFACRNGRQDPFKRSAYSIVSLGGGRQIAFTATMNSETVSRVVALSPFRVADSGLQGAVVGTLDEAAQVSVELCYSVRSTLSVSHV